MQENYDDWFAPLKLPEQQDTENFKEEEEPLTETQRKLNEMEDVARFGVKTVSSIAGLGKDLVNIVAENVGNRQPIISDEPGIEARKLIGRGLEAVGLEGVVTEEGKVAPYETMTGPALDIGSIFGGVGVLAKAPLIKQLPTTLKYITAGAGTMQLLADPEKNMYNVIEELANTEITEESDEIDIELKKIATPLKPIAEYFAADEDDSTLELRAKLLAEEVPFAILGEAFGVGASLTKKLLRRPGATLDDVTGAENAQNLPEYLKEARETTELQKPEARIEYNETPEGVAQVLQQESSGIKRFVQQVFTSRGYWTPKAFNAFEDAIYAQRQQVQHAENVSNRLQKSLDALTEESVNWGREVTESVQEALTTPLTFGRGTTRQEKLDIIMERFDIPETVAVETLNAREMMDNLSKNLVGSSAVPDAIKETIVENAGQYMRRSYRLYEDSGYRPSATAVHEAREYLTRQAMDINPNLTYDEALAKANDNIDDILGGQDLKGVYEYFSKVRKVNTEILQGRQDIPAPIRNLMGEIKEPAENIVLTVSKMSRLIETNKFFKVFNDMGNGKYVFNADDPARNTDIFRVKITGTNSVLDGKYTTPEMYKALKEQESKFVSTYNDSVAGNIYKNFLTLKGTSQKMKTVFSHVTHMRNAIGGAQFAMANGSMPFSRESVQNYKTLVNNIRNGGDTALDETYEKFLRLGIINTNVRVNEFRQLLNTGYESGADTLIGKFTETLQGYGVPKVLTDAPTNAYVAVDDFFKITQFQKELKTLQTAFPNQPLNVLEEEAANIVRNTIPNYDRVPKGIKALREAPLGNFFSFPAEITRTSANIIAQGAREINSGNAVLKRRGARRLAGYAATLSGAGIAAEQTANMLGFNEEEKAAAQVLTEAPWSKTSSRVWAKDDEGNIFYLDTQFYDTYNTVKEPFTILVSEIQQGQLKGQDVDNALISATGEAFKKILAPYANEAILTSTVTDLVYAAISSDGRDPNGKEVFTPGLETQEKIENMTGMLWDAFKPGSVKSIEDLVAARPNAMTGRERATGADILNNVSGLKFQPFVPEESLMYAVNEYMFTIPDIIQKGANHVRTPDDVLKRYKNRQKEIYKNQQELYRKVDAARTLLGEEKTTQILLDSGLSEDQVGPLFQNFFVPEKPNTEYFKKLFEKTPFSDPDVLEKFAIDMRNEYAGMLYTALNAPKPEPQEKDKKESFAKGGEVVVPNAPREPDERIDRMTGQPYNLQAGKAFIDEEETTARAMFSRGGDVVEYAVKGLKAGKEGFENFKKTIDDYTDNLFNKEVVEDTTADVESLRNLILYGDDTVDMPPLSIMEDAPTEFEVDDYIDLVLKDVLTGGPEMPPAPGVKTQEFSKSLNTQRIQELAPDSDEAAYLSELMDMIDPDQELYESIRDTVTPLRNQYSKMTTELEGVTDLPPETQAVQDYLMKMISNDESIPLTEAGKKILAQAQTNTLSKDPELQGLMDKLFKDIPTKVEEQTAPLDLDPVVRAQQIKDFVKDSKKQDPVYRGISDFNEGEYDIAFSVPREIGAHVGTSGQANTILIKDVDPFTMSDQFTVASRGGEKIQPEEIEQFFKGQRETLEEQPMPYTISKGYVNIKNPLEVDTDFGSWNAAQILKDVEPDDFWGGDMGTLVDSIRAAGVSDKQLTETLDRYLPQLIEKSKYWDKLDNLKLNQQLSEVEMRKTELLRADINREFRNMLEDLGFDSIKYRNTVESSMVGEDEFSYILFRPQQFKSVNAEKFDPTDPRFRKAVGGYINEKIARNS